MAPSGTGGAAAHWPMDRTMKATGDTAMLWALLPCSYFLVCRHMGLMQGSGMMRDRDGSVYEGMFDAGKVSLSAPPPRS